MTDLDGTEQMTLSTVRIETTLGDGRQGTGSGFLFKFPIKDSENFVPVLVTNKHVVESAKEGAVYFHTTPTQDKEDAPNDHCRLGIPDFERFWIGHPDPNVDLAIAPIGQWIGYLISAGANPFLMTLAEENIPSADDWIALRAIDDVVMIGYPNGLWDDQNNRPICRRGVTATHPRLDFQKRREFVIDAACFPGSSGSPVFLYNSGVYIDRNKVRLGMRVKLLGILYGGPVRSVSGEIQIITIPTDNRVSVLTQIPINLGYVIKSDRILEMREILFNHPLITLGTSSNAPAA